MANLTEQKLKDMKPGERFATGIGTYPELSPNEIRWVAVRGLGMHDWTIYYHLSDKIVEYVAMHGDKCFTESVIKRLVPCTDEVYSLYLM